MGCELADDREWSEATGLDWGLLQDPARAGVQRLVRDLNAAYRATAALWTQDTTPDGFAWLVGDDAAGNVFAFQRTGDDGSVLVCVVNFAGLPHEDYRLGLPAAGKWRELVNTDAAEYGGSGVGNLGGVRAEPAGLHGRPASANLRLPPLGALWLIPGT
jgi:1,4-alpha-glucan branching enzyme